MNRPKVPWGLLRVGGALWALGALLATFLVLQSAPTADAQTPTTKHKTSAEVSGDGVAPIIECKWELPDMESGDGANDPYPDVTFEYVRDAVHEHDDSPLGPTPLHPCSLPATGTPRMVNGATGMMTITANPGDLPEERRFQLWMAVDHPNGISAIDDVYWDVFHPDGSPKTQVHGIKVPTAECGSLGLSTTPGSMFEAAHHTGQISAAAIDDPNRGIVTMCHEQVKAIYYAEWTISKEQPCGQYRVVAHAISEGVQAPTITNWFNVVCFISGEVDFEELDWGSIEPGRTDRIAGNLLWEPPDSIAPTVRNVGNIGLEPAVRFDRMCSTTLPIPKCIDQFDVSFGRSPATLQHIDPLFAGETVNFDNNRNRVLCADELGKIDFSIHPPSTLPGDVYQGGVEITFLAVRDVCAADQEDILPVPPTPTPTPPPPPPTVTPTAAAAG
jgi:hypothetical protein